MDYKEFSAKIKQKYPQYADMDDADLAKRMVEKYPQYKDVTFDEGKENAVSQEQQKPNEKTNAKSVVDDYANRIVARANTANDQSTALGNKVYQKTGNTTLGNLAAIPEKTLRLAGGTAATAVEFPFVAVDALSGGKIGQTLGDLASKVPGVKKVGEYAQELKQTHPEAYKNLASLAGLAGAPIIAKPAEALQVASKAASKAGRGTAGAGSKLLEGTNNVLGAAAEHLGDVPKETLSAYGWGKNEIAKNIRKYAGKQHEIGNEILEHLEKYEDYMPEKKVVDKALQNMPEINIGKTVIALEQAKVRKPGTPSALKGNEQIDNMIKALEGAADKDGYLNAVDFRNVRVQIDNDVAAAFNKDYKSYVEKAGTDARNQMMSDLISVAKKSGKPEYAEAMQLWAKKLQTVDKLKGYIGSSPESRARRIDSFVSNVFNENKERAREALNQLSEVVGDDILQKAKYAAMAKQLGSTGKPTLLSPVKTGSTMKGLTPLSALMYGVYTGNVPLAATGAGGFALASPAISSKILGPLKAAETKLKKISKKTK